jgi:hypothetical protein
MAKQPNTGLKYSIAVGAPTTEDQLGYDALTFDQVKEVTNYPAFGANVAVIESNPLETGITEKYKGFTNFGSTSVDMDLDDTDPGQAALISAAEGANKNTIHSHKLEYPNGEVRYFQGQVFSAQETPGGQNSMITLSANIEISSAILRVAAP